MHVALVQIAIAAREIDATHRLHRGDIGPVALFPVAEAIVIDRLNGGDPLHALHSVEAWDDRSHRSTVIGRQRLTIHAPNKKCLLVTAAIQRHGGFVVVLAGEVHEVTGGTDLIQ